MGCTDCHAANLAGQQMIDAPVFARLWSSNLTAGQGGVGGVYTAADFERAIRHGLGKDGRALMVMPSNDYHHLSDEDIGRLIAYLMRVPPADNVVGERALGPAGRIASLANAAALFPGTAISHDAPHPASVERAVTVDYGEYILRVCAGCHNPELTGGPMPGGDPEAPPAANLTLDEATGIGTWSEADFARALREGTRPDGSELNAAMPWRAFGGFTDDEIGAMWMYLRSLEAKPQRMP